MKDWNWENKMRQTKNRNHKVCNVYYAEKLTKLSSNILHSALGQLFCVLNRRYLYKIRYLEQRICIIFWSKSTHFLSCYNKFKIIYTENEVGTF